MDLMVCPYRKRILKEKFDGKKETIELFADCMGRKCPFYEDYTNHNGYQYWCVKASKEKRA